MAKKKKTSKRSGADQGARDEPVRIVKLRLSEEEMRTLRVAAAIENQRPGVFAREVVLERARQLVNDFSGRK